MKEYSSNSASFNQSNVEFIEAPDSDLEGISGGDSEGVHGSPTQETFYEDPNDHS